MNTPPTFAHTTLVKESELWEMFAKTGDVEWYEMYLAMKEDKEFRSRK